MKQVVISVGLMTLLMVQSVFARDYQRQFATYGAGEYSCTQYSTIREAGGEEENYLRQWLAGYITAFNLIIGETYDIFGSTDFDGMITWLDERCKKFPHENLTNTVARFTEITFPYRTQVKPETK